MFLYLPFCVAFQLSFFPLFLCKPISFPHASSQPEKLLPFYREKGSVWPSLLSAPVQRFISADPEFVRLLAASCFEQEAKTSLPFVGRSACLAMLGFCVSATQRLPAKLKHGASCQVQTKRIQKAPAAAGPPIACHCVHFAFESKPGLQFHVTLGFGCGNQKTGLPKWVARSVSGMDQNLRFANSWLQAILSHALIQSPDLRVHWSPGTTTARHPRVPL